MLGVDKFTEFGAVIKFMVKTQPDMLFAVRRELLRRISKRFNELGIRITVPQRILVRDDDTQV
jgi:small-conductance mechanosensitive channel